MVSVPDPSRSARNDRGVDDPHYIVPLLTMFTHMLARRGRPVQGCTGCRHDQGPVMSGLSQIRVLWIITEPNPENWRAELVTPLIFAFTFALAYVRIHIPARRGSAADQSSGLC